MLHQEIAPYIQEQIAETLRSGVPLVRPLFWHAPTGQAALTIGDELLLCERLLAAPALRAGQRGRDVYLFTNPCYSVEHLDQRRPRPSIQ